MVLPPDAPHAHSPRLTAVGSDVGAVRKELAAGRVRDHAGRQEGHREARGGGRPPTCVERVGWVCEWSSHALFSA